MLDKIISNIFKNHPNGLNYYPIKSWDFLKVDAYFNSEIILRFCWVFE